MQWVEVIKQHTDKLAAITVTPELQRKLFALIDLTSLSETDTESSIATFSEKAQSPLGHVAAVCVYPDFVRQMAAQFAGSRVQVATVVNFPEGNNSLETVLVQIGRAIQDGATEIDVVFPYLRYLAGERHYCQSFITACKAACGDSVTLKVILETGALIDPAIIADVSLDALTAGADFIKTSTGKIPEGATLEAAATMLLVIKHAETQLGRRLGLKVSGGIRTVQQAGSYVRLAALIMGENWVTPETFRIGASKLVDELLA